MSRIRTHLVSNIRYSKNCATAWAESGARAGHGTERRDARPDRWDYTSHNEWSRTELTSPQATGLGGYTTFPQTLTRLPQTTNAWAGTRHRDDLRLVYIDDV